MAVYILPMFPLGTTLLPGAAMPLNIFEPRYLALIDRCLNPGHPLHDAEHAAEFGVVLIERGHEVGGGDTRTSFGTVARIIDAQSVDDRHRVLAVGVRRIVVERWLPDAPYPLAEVRDWDDTDDAPVTAADVDEVFDSVRRVLGLSVELGDIPSAYLDRVPDELADVALDGGAWATYQMAALAPIGSADRQRILGGATPSARLALVAGAVDDIEMSLRFRLTSPD